MALTVSHEQRRLRTERNVRIGKVITCFYEVPLLAASAQVPNRGDTMPGNEDSAPLKPYFYMYRWGKTIKPGNKIELIVDWIQPEAYS